MTYMIIGVVAIWLSQRLLAAQQAMRFRKQYQALRRNGRDVAVGAAKRYGRRVYVALAADTDGRIRENVIFRGVTVFANGRSEPLLEDTTVADLNSGRLPAGLHPLIAEAAAQSAGFLATAARKRQEKAVATKAR